jgi:glycosyltransferase involved in cell wall biosynthesis
LGLVDSHLVGSVGSLLPLKGHEEFVRAAAIVVGKIRDIEFVIIGDDDERNRIHREYLEQLIIELGLRKRVHIVHWTDDLSLFYRALDVYVSASHSEAFGLSIVEAMASSRSVVATATEGAREIIDEGKTGLLVPIGNVEKLAESIVALLANEGERSRLGDNAREDARERFSLEGMVSAVEKVYLGALKGRNKTQSHRDTEKTNR